MMDSFSFNSLLSLLLYSPYGYVEWLARSLCVFVCNGSGYMRSMVQSLNVNGKCGDAAEPLNRPRPNCMQKDNRSENVNNWCRSKRWSANTTIEMKLWNQNGKKHTMRCEKKEYGDFRLKNCNAYIKTRCWNSWLNFVLNRKTGVAVAPAPATAPDKVNRCLCIKES